MLHVYGMSIRQQALQYGQRRIARRVAKSIPYFGVAVALLTLRSAIRRKGAVGGTIDSVLNAVPFLGAAKNIVEVARGRDFIRDRRVAG